MKIKNLSLYAVLIITVFITSCGKDPIEVDSTVTLRNTLQDSGASEVTYASLFMEADDAFDEVSTVSESDVEFPTALAQSDFNINGLYEINIDKDQISFKIIASEDDPFWGAGGANVFGTFPDGKFDRYYLTFSENHNIESFSSSNSNVNLRTDSDKIIVVEIGGGYELTPTTSFNITLEK